MTQSINRLRLAQLAISQLGLKQITLAGLYRLGLKSGYYRFVTPARGVSSRLRDNHRTLRTDLIPLPNHQELQLVVPSEILLNEANEIQSGQIRLFGVNLTTLVLAGEGNQPHWSQITDAERDLKPDWEVGRFGWAIILARAYYLSRNEDYAQCFWDNAITFLETNPANCGVHWNSAQEVALRLIALVFCIQVFSHSNHSTVNRLQYLGQSIAEHAARIPPTLIYARAQNNNHLISEAAGLYTAAVALPNHPHAQQWRKIGWQWLNHALQQQIKPDGEYIQHSTNYHRLMLQAALWISAIQHHACPQAVYPRKTLNRLEAATKWLWTLTDPSNGQVPNLGPNDGALILPLSCCPFNDYRPVVASAGKAFLDKALYQAGIWDEMSLWLGLSATDTPSHQPERSSHEPGTAPHMIVAGDSWAYFRATHFTARPGHADQLHIDLWFRGLNIAQDAGTYLYTAPKPWNNALTHTAVHNTVMIDDCEQMHRAGRFLYLNWAQAEFLGYESGSSSAWQRMAAQHNGYRRLGITHLRKVTVTHEKEWEIHDQVTGPSDKKDHKVRLHWLLPDWQYQIDENPHEAVVNLQILSPFGWVKVQVQVLDNDGQVTPNGFQWGIVRAGMLIQGNGDVDPTWGWTSPTYGYKIPALSFAVTINSTLPLQFTTQWLLP